MNLEFITQHHFSVQIWPDYPENASRQEETTTDCCLTYLQHTCFEELWYSVIGMKTEATYSEQALSLACQRSIQLSEMDRGSNGV